jgi:hypothetical protein
MVSREGDEIEAAEIALISEVMKRSGLIVADEGASNAEAKQTVVEGEDGVSHPGFRGHQDPGVDINIRCAGTKSHTYDE